MKSHHYGLIAYAIGGLATVAYQHSRIAKGKPTWVSFGEADHGAALTLGETFLFWPYALFANGQVASGKLYGVNADGK